MSKLILIVTLNVFIFASCSSGEDGLCQCVDATNRVNELSATFLDGTYSEERKDSLDQARKLSDSLCAPYQQMAPEELHKAAKNCSSLKMNPPQ